MWNTSPTKNKQKKISVSFKENELDLKLYEWLSDKAKVIGYSNAVKEMLYKIMEREEIDK